MPHLNHTGPDGEGSKTGRGLGKCRKEKEASLEELGRGKGMRRKSGGGQGKGRRLKSSKLFENQEENKECNSERE